MSKFYNNNVNIDCFRINITNQNQWYQQNLQLDGIAVVALVAPSNRPREFSCYPPGTAIRGVAIAYIFATISPTATLPVFITCAKIPVWVC